MTGQEGMRKQGDERKQAQEGGGGAGNGLDGPLTLGFDAEMFTHMAKGGFHLPTTLEEDQDVERVEGEVGGQQGLSGQFTGHIANENEADRHGQLTRMISDGLMGT